MGCDPFWIWSRDSPTETPLMISKASQSICKVYILDQIYSGFFLKFSIKEKNFFYLVTEKSPITEEMINNKQKIIINYDNDIKKVSITLNSEERNIKIITENNINVIIIEIIPNDKIEENYFLVPSKINSKEELKNKAITIISNIGYSNGKIEKILDKEFTYTIDNISNISKEENIRAGNPIFIKDSIDIIGITKEIKKNCNEYYAEFIEIINIFKEEEVNNLKKIELNDGGYYRGELNEEEIPKGKGKYFFKNGECYDGDIIDDKFEGKGKFIYANGEYYIGEWKNNLRHGKGIFYYKSGNIKYDGDFANDKFEGDGKYCWESGEYYIGQFKNGLNNGKGKLYYNNGKLEYEGEFVNDKFEGEGKYIYEDEQYYKGQFKNGLKHGKGTLYYKDGKIEYEGDFLEGNYDGEGKYIYENGDYYVGQFKNGLCHGKGKEFDKDGKLICEGEWNNDEKVE